jgi:hypothetical protein
LGVKLGAGGCALACVKLPDEVAVVMGNGNGFGELPTMERGKVVPF